MVIDCSIMQAIEVMISTLAKPLINAGRTGGESVFLKNMSVGSSIIPEIIN
ncbi:MAG: hypothetical protein STSR0009_29810 [Methanoregula sp.]